MKATLILSHLREVKAVCILHRAGDECPKHRLTAQLRVVTVLAEDVVAVEHPEVAIVARLEARLAGARHMVAHHIPTAGGKTVLS